MGSDYKDMADMRQQAAAAALAPPEEELTDQERWERTQSGQFGRTLGQVGTTLAQTAVGDWEGIIEGRSREVMSAERAAQRAREWGDEEGYREHTERARTGGHSPQPPPSSAHQNSVEAAGQKRERSLQAQTLDQETKTLRAAIPGYQSEVDAAEGSARDAYGGLQNKISEYRELERSNWEVRSTIANARREFVRQQQATSDPAEKARLGKTINAHNDLFGAYEQEWKKVQASMEAYEKGVEGSEDTFRRAKENLAALEQRIQGVEGRAADVRATPHAQFSPGKGDISELRRLWGESARAEDVWKSTEKGPQADALREAAHKAANEFQAKAKALGVSDYLGDALDVESARGWEEMVRENAERAFRDQDREGMGVAEADIQRARQQEREALGRVQGHESEIRRGVTAGIPGAEPPTPSSAVSSAKIRPGTPAQTALGLVTFAATAIPAMAMAQIRRTSDPYEQFRLISLHAARGPLEKNHVSPEGWGLLLQDRELANQLVDDGLISSEVYQHLEKKRSQHNY